MYYPDGMDLSAKEMVEYSQRKREIRHTNTRLPAHLMPGSTSRASMLSGSTGGESAFTSTGVPIAGANHDTNG